MSAFPQADLASLISASGVAPTRVNEASASFEVAIAKQATRASRRPLILDFNHDLPVIADSLQIGTVMTEIQLNTLVEKMKKQIAQHSIPLVIADNQGTFKLDDEDRLTFQLNEDQTLGD